MSIATQIRCLTAPLSIPNAAALLNLHPQTLYKWTRQGLIPTLRFGSAVRIDPTVLADWVEARQTQ